MWIMQCRILVDLVSKMLCSYAKMLALRYFLCVLKFLVACNVEDLFLSLIM